MTALQEMLDSFLYHERDRRFSRCTLRNHRATIGAFVAWLESQGATRAEQIGKPHLDAWITHLNVHRTKAGMPLKPQSLNLHIGNARQFLCYLAGRGLLPMAMSTGLCDIRAPRILPQSVLTHAQARKLLDHSPTNTADGFRNRAMLELLYSAGIRAAELLGLDVGHVDFAHATARVIGKGQKERVVPIGRVALHYLVNYIKTVRPQMLREADEQALFLNRKGRRLRYNAFAQIVRDCAARAGLGMRVTAHTFRRSCATELLRSGANMYHVKDLLGHESLNTLRHYAKLTILDIKKTHETFHPRELDDLS